MNSFIKSVDKILSIILILMVGFLSFGVILAVFLRYFFSLSYGWFEEYLIMLFVSINFLGAAICIREKQHISITTVVDAFSGWGKTFVEICIQSILIAVSAFLIVYSCRWIVFVGSTVSPCSGIPFGFYYAIVPISSGISIFYALINIVSYFVPIEPADTGYFIDSELLKESAK